jgi:hypothetical protein
MSATGEKTVSPPPDRTLKPAGARPFVASSGSTPPKPLSPKPKTVVRARRGQDECNCCEYVCVIQWVSVIIWLNLFILLTRLTILFPLVGFVAAFQLCVVLSWVQLRIVGTCSVRSGQ